MCDVLPFTVMSLSDAFAEGLVAVIDGLELGLWITSGSVRLDVGASVPGGRAALIVECNLYSRGIDRFMLDDRVAYYILDDYGNEFLPPFGQNPPGIRNEGVMRGVVRGMLREWT